MTTSLDQIVTRTLGRLHGLTNRDVVNVLNGALADTTGTAVVVTYTPDANLVAGSVIQIDYEQMLVMVVATNTLTVVRGWNGTTAATHANGSIVYVEPDFPRQQVLDAVLAELQSLPRQLFQVATVTITWPANTLMVELPSATNVYRILDARRVDGLTHYDGAPLSIELRRNAADYTSGYALILHSPEFAKASTVRLVYAKDLTVTGLTSTSTMESTGLDERAWDVLPLGAGARVLLDKTSLRADLSRQGPLRTAEEVRLDDLGQIAARWRAEAERRIGAEITRLLEVYPYRER